MLVVCYVKLIYIIHNTVIRGHFFWRCEDKSSEQIFYSTWSQRIATALQIGNAIMIHNIPRGISVKSRATGDRVTDEPPSRSAHPAMDVQGALLAGNDTYSESESDSNSEPEPGTPI